MYTYMQIYLIHSFTLAQHTLTRAHIYRWSRLWRTVTGSRKLRMLRSFNASRLWYLYINIYIYVCISVYVHINIHVYTYIFMHIYTHVYVHINIHVYTYIFMHMYTHTRKHIHMKSCLRRMVAGSRKWHMSCKWRTSRSLSASHPRNLYIHTYIDMRNLHDPVTQVYIVRFRPKTRHLRFSWI